MTESRYASAARAFDILVTLVEGAGETIDKDQLIARTWPDTVVDEGSLRVHVAALRKALGDGRAGNCAPPRALPDCCAIGAVPLMPWRSSSRSTIGSPRASAPQICERQKAC
jgi:hypothetical protein